MQVCQKQCAAGPDSKTWSFRPMPPRVGGRIDVLEVERRMQNADFLSLEEVKASLGLHDRD